MGSRIETMIRRIKRRKLAVCWKSNTTIASKRSAGADAERGGDERRCRRADAARRLAFARPPSGFERGGQPLDHLAQPGHFCPQLGILGFRFSDSRVHADANLATNRLILARSIRQRAVINHQVRIYGRKIK